MRVIGLFGHLMSSAVTVEPRVGLDEYLSPLYGAPVTISAHLSGERKMVRDQYGQEVVSAQSAYLQGHPAVQLGDRVTLSTADVGSTEEAQVRPPLLAVERRFDADGPHHTVLRFGRASQNAF